MVKNAKVKSPPKSKLPLTWCKFNGLQEMGQRARLANIKLAPLGTLDSFAAWCRELQKADLADGADTLYSWYQGIGWVEGHSYNMLPGYLEAMGFPYLQKMLDRLPSLVKLYGE